MSREKRRFNAKLINISKKEGTKKDQALSAKLIMLAKNSMELTTVEEKNEKNKD